jgi:hypothetical protein
VFALALRLGDFVEIHHAPFWMLLVSLASGIDLLRSQLLQTLMKFSRSPIKSATALKGPLFCILNVFAYVT